MEGRVRMALASMCCPFYLTWRISSTTSGAGHLDCFSWEAPQAILVVWRHEGITDARREVFLQQNLIHLDRDGRHEFQQAVRDKNLSPELPWEKGSFSIFLGEANLWGNQTLSEALTALAHCPVDNAREKLPFLEQVFEIPGFSLDPSEQADSDPSVHQKKR